MESKVGHRHRMYLDNARQLNSLLHWVRQRLSAVSWTAILLTQLIVSYSVAILSNPSVLNCVSVDILDSSPSIVVINSLTDTAPLRHRCITIEEGLVTAMAAHQRQTSVNRQPPPTHHQSPRDPARRDETRPLVRQNRVGATTTANTRKMKILVTRSENSFLNSGELLIHFSLLNFFSLGLDTPTFTLPRG